MEFTSHDTNYSAKWLGHLSRFIEQYNLFSKDTPLLVTVSGGIDSIVMLFTLNELRRYGYSNQLRVIHINHASREGQDEEESFVRTFCEQLGIEFNSEKLFNLNTSKNFEYKARLGRYEAFDKIKKKNELIVLAHHIDDSFEWSLLQTLRSSTIDSIVGIPVKNHEVIRPLMCVTKSQVEQFAKCYDLPFITDPTNDEIKYERNFLRHEVISAFKERHPKYLKHYVYRHNEIARRLGLHLIDKNKTIYEMSVSKKSVLIYSLSLSQDNSGLSELILEGLKALNPNSRGQVNSQIQKIVKAMENGKTGPISLTNGFKAYIDHHMVLLTKQESPETKLQFIEYKTFSFSEFEEFLINHIPNQQSHLCFPFVVFIKGSKLDKRNFKLIFNSEGVLKFSDSNTQYYPALKLLREWSKKRNRHRVLRLNFLTSV